MLHCFTAHFTLCDIEQASSGTYRLIRVRYSVSEVWTDERKSSGHEMNSAAWYLLSCPRILVRSCCSETLHVDQFKTATERSKFRIDSARSEVSIHTKWFKYDREKLWLLYTQIVPVIYEPPYMLLHQCSEHDTNIYTVLLKHIGHNAINKLSRQRDVGADFQTKNRFLGIVCTTINNS